MRGAFGLVSLLVVTAIILFVLAGRGCSGQSYLQTVMNTKKEKELWANQVGGKDEQGRPFSQTLSLSDWPERGPLKGLLVTRVDPAGPAATHFGLAPGDVILEVGPQEVGGPIIDSAGAGGDFLTDAFAKGFPITIQRGGQKWVLPDQAAAAAAILPAGSRGAASPGAAPATQGQPKSGVPSLPEGLVPGGAGAGRGR